MIRSAGRRAGRFLALTSASARSTARSRPTSTRKRARCDSSARLDPKARGIQVVELGHGFWGNGGWVLTGGLLRRCVDGASTFELYGKAVIREFPHFPFPFHQAIPHETGFEFFLLHRRRDV